MITLIAKDIYQAAKNHWIDRTGMLHVDLKKESENGVLFTAEFYALLANAGFQFGAGDIRVLLDNQIYKPGERRKTPGLDDDHYSHDNDTGFRTAACLLAEYYDDDSYRRKMFLGDYWKNFPGQSHPRDFGFRMATKGGFWRVLAVPFLWITSVAMFISCFQDYKVRNENKILKTDGKLLAWLRCQALCMPITFKICSAIIRRNKEFGSWKRCFEMYFKVPQHPNRLFADRVYNMSKFDRVKRRKK